MTSWPRKRTTFSHQVFRRSAIANTASFKCKQMWQNAKRATQCPYSWNQNIMLNFKIYFNKNLIQVVLQKWRLLKFFAFIKRSRKQLLSSIDDTWKSSLILKKCLRSLCNEFSYIVFFDLYFWPFHLVVGVFENLFTESY